MPPGSVSGVVTAKGANGEIIKGANVMVQLWTTDAATEALDRAALRAEDQRELQQNLEALQALSSAIRRQSFEKRRESVSPFPPLN